MSFIKKFFMNVKPSSDKKDFFLPVTGEVFPMTGVDYIVK
jgi:hypothetical protein